jgi:hypothetical protein
VALLLPVALWPASAGAATTTISDQTSCQSIANSNWNARGSICNLGTNSVASGDTLTISGVSAVTYSPWTVSSGATLNVDNGGAFFANGGLVSNSGTINVNDGQLKLGPAGATNTASGQINVTSAASKLVVDGTLTNQGTISVACSVPISYVNGGTITGNPPQLTGDCTPPSASPTQSPAANAAGWNNTDVTVTWNWVDNLGGSGVDPNNCTTNSTSSGEGTLTLNATCKDLAGNQGSASYTVKVDKTPPTVSAAAAAPLNGNNGWYTSPVTVDFTCADALSEVATCPSPQTLSSDGSAVSSMAQTATDKAGNTSAASNVVTVKIDQTPPTITASLTPPNPASTGWYNQSTGAPTVSFTCSDATSGIPAAGTSGACPLKFTFPDGANQSYTASVSDNAGNSASAGVGAGSTSVGSAGAGAGGGKVMIINVDLTSPTVTYSSHAVSYTVDQQVQITCTATDATSGIASSTCQNINGPAYSFGLGSHTYSATATDNAGNVGHGSTSLTVTVTSSSLQSLINRFCTDPSVAASLSQDVANIAQALNAGAKMGMLQGFTQLVQAQTGKSLTSDQAKVLITLADAL